jgi:hypothetical protein
MKEANRYRLPAIIAGLLGVWGCGSSGTEGVVSGTGTLETPLFARSRVLWPVVDGVATVSVCWAESQFETTYPVAALRPDLEARLPERKQWIREIIEEQWNGRTALRFTGWHDCSANSADVELTPIDTGVTASCADGNLGRPCVTALGRDLLDYGGGVFLNVYFGEEVLYSSRYQQANPGARYNENNEPNSNREYAYWLPQACFDDFEYAWSTNNSLTEHSVDINDSAVLAEFMAIYENCLKFNALHEFGHIAGFSHEHQRSDVSSGCDAEDDQDAQYVGDTPLGPFDLQSIMSYCRTDNAATLTDQDVEMTNVVYRDGVAGGATVGGSAGAAAPDDPMSTPRNWPRNEGCNMSSPAPNGLWWLAIGAFIATVRSRRARKVHERATTPGSELRAQRGGLAIEFQYFLARPRRYGVDRDHAVIQVAGEIEGPTRDG